MRNQQGMTLIGMLLTLTAVIILGIFLLRVVPVYIQHYSVTSSVKSLNQIPPSEFGYNSAVNVSVLKRKLENQLYVNAVDDLVGKGIKIKPLSQYTYLVTIQYQVTKPLVYNVSLLFDFDVSQEVNIGKS